MNINKITSGFVTQTFSEDGKLISQDFIAGDSVDWEDENFEPTDDEGFYHPFEMKQPSGDSIEKIDAAAKMLKLDASGIENLFHALSSNLNELTEGEPLDGDEVEILSEAFYSYLDTYYANV